MQIRHLLALATFVLLTSPFTVAQDDGVQDDGATHKEIAPLKFEIGPGGKIETMSMDSQG